ncbi:hypothetical protein [Psychroflexus gondwanensis]|uniref:hypothetical protein n=1 Tax=Psychroflexus gondwanensis TaxID=251 RepID=UPI0003A6946B|nr:hypothetical protein [Psychroflexus gondwanensis]
MRTTLFISLLLLVFLNGFSQSSKELDSLSVFQDIFDSSSVEGELRNFTMATYNRGSLQDYSTNATGGTVKIKTKNFKGFEAGMQTSFTYKTIGNDLNAVDPIAGRGDKWELELYDIFNKGEFEHLIRLDELYLQYNFGKSYLAYGKIKTEYTRLINASDGRMNRFAHQGAWLHLNFDSPHKLDLAWLNRFSPRSSYDWFDFDEAFGLVNQGFQPNGEAAIYKGFYPTQGVAIFNYGYINHNFNFHVYNFLFDKISNIVWLEADYDYKTYKLGLQYAHSQALSYGEQLDEVNRYMQPDERANVLSSKLSWFTPKWEVSAAYTKAFDTGRFLFPKELGRDHFYTSIPRSRLEGLGGVDVFTLRVDYQLSKPNLHFGVSYQDLSGAEVQRFQLNKYNIDSTRQFNTQITFEPEGFFKGLHLDLLWVYRTNKTNEQQDLFFNRSNFHQINLVTNFYF